MPSIVQQRFDLVMLGAMVIQKKKKHSKYFSASCVYDRVNYLESHLQLVSINISNSQGNFKLSIGLINFKSDQQNSLINLSAIKTCNRYTLLLIS